MLGDQVTERFGARSPTRVPVSRARAFWGAWVLALSLGLALAVVAPMLRDLAVVFTARIRFPFDIDWIESGQLYHARRLLDGAPIYRDASQGFLPHPYPPFHYVVLGALAPMFGLSHATGRALSVACTVAVMFALAWATYRTATRPRTPSTTASHSRVASRASVATEPRARWSLRALGLVLGLLVLGAVARTYPHVYGWYDLARSDALAAALPIAAGMVLALPSGAITRRRTLVAALLLTAGMYTKQTCVFFVPALVATTWLEDRRRAWELLFATALFSSVTLVALEVATRGAFHGWLLSTQAHALELRRLPESVMLVVNACPTMLLVPVVLVFFRRAKRTPSRFTRHLTGLWLAAWPASFAPYLKAFGAANNLIPLFLLSAAITFVWIADLASQRSATDLPAVAVTIAAGLLAVGSARFDVGRFAPSEALRAEMRQILDEGRALPGSISCPLHPFLATQLGKGGEQPSLLAHVDAFFAKRPGVTLASYVDDLRARKPDWVVSANMEIERELTAALAEDYEYSHNFHPIQSPRVELLHSVPRMAFRRRPGR